jgi:hypothetical protein
MKHRKMLLASIVAMVIGLILWLVEPNYYLTPFGLWLGLSIGGRVLLIVGILVLVITIVLELTERNKQTIPPPTNPQQQKAKLEIHR